MVQQSILSLLLLPALALCAPQHKSMTTTVVAYTTVNQYATPSATSPASYSTEAPSSTQASDAAPTLSSGKGQVQFINNCKFDVTLTLAPGPGCSAGEGGVIAAGSSWNDTLAPCASGNTALKVYKGTDEGKPMQFEYGVDSKNVWYDMSFIDCLAAGYDFSECAGADFWSMKSENECHEYKCSGGKECCENGYCDSDGSAIVPAPNTGCGADQGHTDVSAMGIYIELCGSG